MVPRWEMPTLDPVTKFAALVSLPARDLDLAAACLLIALAGDPGTQPAACLAELDRWAEGIGDLDGLRHRLFAELGLRGDTRNFYDPDNSFLHRVMLRRVGIPITLSVLVMEVGLRAGIQLEGVGMPGYFLVGLPGTETYLDAFGGGGLLDEAGCAARFREATGSGPEVSFGPHLLPVVGPHAILARMLANLQAIYELRRSGRDLEWVARMRLALPGAGTPEVRSLASALEMQGKFLQAAAELERRADQAPADSSELAAAAQLLRSRFN